MPAYIIVQVEVSDPEMYQDYTTRVPSTLTPFGGEFLVRGGKLDVLEGEWLWPRCVILKFPDVASAKGWHASEAYQGPKAMRKAASTGNMIIVEGVAPL
ncbi:MAG: hypothetical protein CBB68_09355 [Rhodospirillaceae bacterium TMED8]|nr:D-fructose-6-phosphate amidotransferase [Magnetovibrio sp.]OUT50069.1 MAG: hypothetical protein CBB68_09355 [Rhodospirillaceae bacterium TMED8]